MSYLVTLAATQATPPSHVAHAAQVLQSRQRSANEDAGVLLDDPGAEVAVVVDGAGIPAELRRGCRHSVAWYASHLADVYARRLGERKASLREALRAAIAEVAGLHDGECDLAGGSPSATVAAYRVSGSVVEYLVLCDASLVLAFANGRVQEVTDDRLAQVTGNRARGGDAD